MLSPTLMPTLIGSQDRGSTGGSSHESTIYHYSFDAAGHLQLAGWIVAPLLLGQWLDNVWGIFEHSFIAHLRLQCKIEA